MTLPSSVGSENSQITTLVLGANPEPENDAMLCAFRTSLPSVDRLGLSPEEERALSEIVKPSPSTTNPVFELFGARVTGIGEPFTRPMDSKGFSSGNPRSVNTTPSCSESLPAASGATEIGVVAATIVAGDGLGRGAAVGVGLGRVALGARIGADAGVGVVVGAGATDTDGDGVTDTTSILSNENSTSTWAAL
jgi:hypothetical protein